MMLVRQHHQPLSENVDYIYLTIRGKLTPDQEPKRSSSSGRPSGMRNVEGLHCLYESSELTLHVSIIGWPSPITSVMKRFGRGPKSPFIRNARSDWVERLAAWRDQDDKVKDNLLWKQT